MADQDTTVKVENGENIDEKVETTKVEDETSKDTTQDDTTDTGNEQDENKSTDDTDESQDKTEEADKAEFKKRFTQLKGETTEEYLKNLEDAYANSSTEGQRNAKRATDAEQKFDKIATLVANDPEFAAKLDAATGENSPSPVVDPAVAWARGEMEKQYKADFNAFSEEHPEIISDIDKYNAVTQELDIIAAAHEARGVKLSMAEGLRKAWISLGYDVSDKKEEVVNKIKDQASATSTQGKSSKSEDKPTFTAEQIKVAEKMGLTEKDLAKYN